MSDPQRAMTSEAAATPPLLAIDTSSEQGAVALVHGTTVSFRSWPAGRSHTTSLLSEIHTLLSAASLDVVDLGAIGVATGPGTFTGLRAGFGVAKGFYLATGAPIVGLPTLEATALPLRQPGCPSLPRCARVEGGSSGSDSPPMNSACPHARRRAMERSQNWLKNWQ